MTPRIPPHHDPACFGCGDNPVGLRLPLPAAPALTDYEAYFTFDERHQGGPGIVHGGIVSAALDEAAGLLATWHSFPCVTARLFVRYRRPVPIDTELLVTAHLVEVLARRLHVDARITDGDESLAEARVALLHVPFEHFLATPQGRAAAARWSGEDRASAPEPGGEEGARP